MNTILLLHAFSCLFMTGVIWLIQLIVYPFFQRIGEKEFLPLHEFHLSRITWLVGPVMSLELITGAWLFLGTPRISFFWNLVSVVAIWIWTAFINVPSHRQLHYSAKASKVTLVRRNWPRTILWTLRSCFLFVIMLSVFGE